MGLPKAKPVEHEIGKYICPKTKLPVPLLSYTPLSGVAWPMVIDRCPECGQKHAIESQDVLHPPVFGYE
jgi:hypothetical protein